MNHQREIVPAIGGSKLTHHPMENIRMVRVGNRIVNLMQITFAEYSPAFTPPPLDSNVSKNSNHHPISYTRPEPKPSSLTVHFFGGEHHQFFGDLADELNAHFDLFI